ncbi:MAG: 50S ribosomal protein L23 [Spirochaetota bacterium]
MAISKGKNKNGSVILIKQPWVTEKAVNAGALRKYVFVVDNKANKPEVKKMIEKIYSIKVADVNITNTRGKSKRLGKSMGKISGFKKAIVTLKEGNTIDIMPK